MSTRSAPRDDVAASQAPSNLRTTLTPPDSIISREPIFPPPQIALPSTPDMSTIEEEGTPSALSRHLGRVKAGSVHSVPSVRSLSPSTFGQGAQGIGLHQNHSQQTFGKSKRFVDDTPNGADRGAAYFDEREDNANGTVNDVDDDQDLYPDDETERTPHASSFPAPPQRGTSLDKRAARFSNGPTDEIFTTARQAVPPRRLGSGADTFSRPRDVERNTVAKLTNGSQSGHAFLRDEPERPGRAQSPSGDSQYSSGFYRRTGAKTDLDYWNPPARGALSLKPDHGPIANLPDWTNMRANDPTAFPISHIQKDVEYSIQRLVSPAIFEQLLNDRLGRHRFREYLNTVGADSRELDCMLDIQEHVRAIQMLKKGSEALHEVYVRNPESRVELPSMLSADLLESLRTTHAIEHQLQGVHTHLAQTLFNSTFQTFIRASITEHSRVRLGSFATADDSDGLGAAFVLTNPRLRDHPIVLVSPAFCELTEYPQEAILQRNCRFLQGPSTSPASVQRIRDALNTGSASVELLLNYKRSGEPFWNLLCIIPLRDAKGRVQYFIGGQVNVTGSLTTQGLSFLLGGGRSYETLPDEATTRRYGVEASPTLMRFLSTSDLHADSRSVRKMGTESRVSLRDRAGAAGGVGPGSTGGRAAGAQTTHRNGYPMPALEPLTKDRDGHKNGGLGLSNGTSNGGGGGLMKRLNPFRKAPAPSQSLGLTAESEVRRTGGTLEEHMEDFNATYSRLALVRREKREILFVTAALLSFFDLPTATPEQVHDSALLHADVLSLVCGESREETRRVRTMIQDAIRGGKALKVPARIRQPKSGLFGSSSAAIKSSVLHVCPLRDVQNQASAVVIVFA